MAITYSVPLKTARMTATRDYLADGTLEILDAGDVLLVAVGLSATGGTVNNDVWTLAFDGPSDAVGTGTAAKAQIKDSGGVAVITGLGVGMTGSGSDVEMQNTSLASGQTVTVTSATIQHSTEI